jgi:hypothetical protein
VLVVRQRAVEVEDQGAGGHGRGSLDRAVA